MLQVRKAEDRGLGRTAWLDSRHSFSFANYYDPEQIGFSDLLVINDDRVVPSRGFGTHPHQDMEIFSYVLDGELEHKDSMGVSYVSKPGDIQMMSAGSGIYHSEYNHSERDLLRFLQIWIVPDKKAVTPRYDHKTFSVNDKRGKFKLVISPNGEPGTLPIYQDAQVWAGLFDTGEAAEFELENDRYAYIQMARGKLSVNGVKLREGDGVRVRNETSLSFENGEGAEVLLFDLRPRELPELR